MTQYSIIRHLCQANPPRANCLKINVTATKISMANIEVTIASIKYSGISGGHEVFSAMTGGRPLCFLRRISGGSRSSEPFGLELMAERPMALSEIEGLVEENAEGAKIPCRYVVEITRPGALEQKKRPHEPPAHFSVMSNADNKLLWLVRLAFTMAWP
jgi:hypothetical protein